MQSTRIFITEVGTLSTLGMGFASIADALQKKPVPSSVKDFEFHQFTTPVPCFLIKDFDPVAVLGKKGLRTKDNATKMLLGGLDNGFKAVMETASDKDRPGLCIGTAFGSVQSIGDFLSDSIVNGVNNVNPMLFANTVLNSPTGNANIRYQARNLSATIATGFNAGLDAIIYSCDYMQRGYLNRIIAGGLEEVSYYALLGFDRTGILSKSGRSRPFALDADGCVAGEACALALLETEEASKERGSKPLAQVVGYASAFDPSLAADGTPDSSVAQHVIHESCKNAGISIGNISFIASGANGSAISDTCELNAISSTFGASVPVAAYKYFTGECYGASGAQSLLCALSDMKNNRISGVLEPYQTRGSIALTKGTIDKVSEHAMVISYSCEGNCSAVVIKNCA